MGRNLFGRVSGGQHTARQAVTIFLVTLLSVVFFRRFVLEKNDPYKCHALMEEGQWYQDNTWLTPGCRGEGYGAQSMRECMRNRKISLIGDHSTQDLYWALRQKLDAQTVVEPAQNDLSHEDDDLTIEYLWDPYGGNRSELFDYLRAYQNGQPSKPTVLVIGSPRLLAERGALNEYREKLDSMVDPYQAAKSFANPGLQNFDIEDGPGDLLLFAPLQEPFALQASSVPSAYSDMNKYLREKAGANGIDVLWSFDRMTAGREDKYLDDKITPHPDVVRKRADLLVSLRCTPKFSQTRSFPNLRSCCGTWKHRNWIQTSFLVLGLAILPATVATDFAWPVLREQDRPVLRAFSAFTASISLQYLTDRTHIFEQVQRLELVPFNLGFTIVISLAVGILTIRRSAQLKKLVQGEKQPSLPFLPRDQTDEIKGWMQLCIITYHYNMAWTADWFWEIIRVCVASYLFLTGFGHTVYFLRKGDYSSKRVVAVMLRTNLLPVTLAYVLRTRWLMYYYMPLASFWFLVIYATLAIGAKYNTYRTFVIAKILASAYLVHTFINVLDLPETAARVVELVFKMSLNADSFFHHRVQIDQYIVYIGMLTAMLYIWASDALEQDSPPGHVKRIFRKYFGPLKILCITLSAFSFVYFWYWAHTRFASQRQWKDLQPYTTPIPILTFLVLRNGHSSARNYFSFAFAWLGRYSGEMYVMQNHLWLAGDQQAVLRTGLFHGNETVLGDRWRDLLLLTPLYLIICCVVGDSTAVITTWFTKEAPPRQSVPADGTAHADEAETGLLSEKDGDADQGVSLYRQQRWRHIVNVTSAILWPRRVRDRGLLLLATLWLLNLVSRSRTLVHPHDGTDSAADIYLA